MRVAEIPRTGPPEIFRIREYPTPSPSADETVISVKAIGINFADIMGRLGLYPDAPPFPFVPGYEVAGLEQGTGRRVVALTRFGGYATEVVVPRRNVYRLPESLSFEEGAALPVNYLTAWCSLVDLARIRSGDRVLIFQAAGGVGIAALQIARHFGATVWGTVGSDPKADFLRSVDVHPIVYTRESPKGPFDIILDPRGGSTFREDMQLLAPFGRIVFYGASELVTGTRRNMLRVAWQLLRWPKIKPLALMNSNKGIYGLNLMKLQGHPELIVELSKILLKAVEEGWVRPRVDKTFPLERVAEAHRYIQERRNIGKVVLTT